MPSADRPEAGPGEPDYRFTLANERTFLAYERTAIGLVAASLAVFHLLERGWPEVLLGALLLVAGSVAAIGGYARFRAVDHAVRRGEPLPRSLPVEVTAVAVVLCLVAVALSVLV